MAEKAKITISAEDRTGPAFQTATRNVQAVLGSLRALPGVAALGTAAIGAMAAAVSAVRFQGLVDGIDALNDIKDITGSSIENISALEDVAKRAGHSLEAVEGALFKVTKELTSAKVDGDFAQNLKNIGLSVEQLRDQDPAETLRQIAVALAKFEDGPRQAQLIFAIFGKTVKEIGPFLKDLAEAGSLNATVLSKQADEADKFNKNMAQLRKNSEDAGRAVVSQLLPGINSLFESFKRTRQESGLLVAALVTIGQLQPAALLGKLLPERGNVDDTADKIQRLNTLISETQEKLQRDPGNEYQQRRLAALQRRLGEVRGEAEAAATAMANALNQSDGVPPIPKPEPPRPADTAGAAKSAADAYAKLRAEMESNIKAITRRQDEAQDVIRFGERMSQQLYTNGLQSLEKYFADQDKARQDNLAALRQATDEEIAQRQRLLAASDKPEEREKIRAEIAEARAKLAAGEREADQSARLAVGERARAVEQLRDQVNALDAEIKDLAAGSTVNSDLLQIAERVRAAGRLMTQAGASPGEVAARTAELGRLLEVQRQMAKAREDYANITNDVARAEEKLLIAAREGGAGLLETERQVRELRAGALRQLEALIAKERERLQQNPGNEQLQRQVAELEITAARARAAVDPTKLRFDAAADNIGESIADGFARAVTEGTKLRDIVKDIGRDIARIVTQELVTKPLATEVSNLVKGSGSSGGNWLSALWGIVSSAYGSGSGGGVDYAAKDLGSWDTGGYTGNGGAREPAGVVHRGEFVFSAAAVANLGRRHLDDMHRAARAGRQGYAGGGYVGQGQPGADRAMASRSAAPVNVYINNAWAAGTTQSTVDQASVRQGRQVARALARGDA